MPQTTHSPPLGPEHRGQDVGTASRSVPEPGVPVAERRGPALPPAPGCVQVSPVRPLGSSPCPSRAARCSLALSLPPGPHSGSSGPVLASSLPGRPTQVLKPQGTPSFKDQPTPRSSISPPPPPLAHHLSPCLCTSLVVISHVIKRLHGSP